jgi:hypothetical protein
VFKNGDGPTTADIVAEHVDGDVAFHVSGDEDWSPYASVYMDPVAAAEVATRLLLAAEAAQQHRGGPQ